LLLCLKKSCIYCVHLVSGNHEKQCKTSNFNSVSLIKCAYGLFMYELYICLFCKGYIIISSHIFLEIQRYFSRNKRQNNTMCADGRDMTEQGTYAIDIDYYMCICILTIKASGVITHHITLKYPKKALVTIPVPSIIWMSCLKRAIPATHIIPLSYVYSCRNVCHPEWDLYIIIFLKMFPSEWYGFSLWLMD
jgi:hypothetical protein